MRGLLVFLVVSIVALSALVSAGPTLVALLNAAVPLVIVGGLVVMGIRIVWHYTDRY